jgi:hypothetical protein
MWNMAVVKRSLLGVTGVTLGAALLSATPISLRWSTTGPTLSSDSAQARIGHPLSPGSVAGVNRRVNRRTARRAYYGGAAAVGAAAAYYGSAGNNYYGGGYSPYDSSGYNGLYSYAPGTVGPSATPVTTQSSTDTSTQDALLPSNSEDLYAACLYRNYGSCPQQ